MKFKTILDSRIEFWWYRWASIFKTLTSSSSRNLKIVYHSLWLKLHVPVTVQAKVLFLKHDNEIWILLCTVLTILVCDSMRWTEQNTIIEPWNGYHWFSMVRYSVIDSTQINRVCKVRLAMNKSCVFYNVIFDVYVHMENRERARASHWKQRRQI